MDIKGRQLRRLKSLLPEDKQVEFRAIFAGAFTKEDVTQACEVVLEKSAGSWAMIKLRHLNRTIATIDLREEKPSFNDKHEDYIFRVHGESKNFRVYKLRE